MLLSSMCQFVVLMSSNRLHRKLKAASGGEREQAVAKSVPGLRCKNQV